MAQETISESISRLEASLTAIRTKISAQEELKEVEEGGAGGKHRTEFTDINKLYQQAQKLQTRLDTLYRATT